MMGQAVSRPGPSEAAPHATQVHHQEVGKALTTVSSQQGRGVSSQARRTATKHAPWYVVPADNKWFTRAVVAAAIADALGSLDLHYPEMSPARLMELARVRRALRGKA